MNVRDFLRDRLLFLDGGMGTLLQAEGLKPGEDPETWNLTHPEVIQNVHRAYFDAGSNVVNTNTFGANLLRFSEKELEKIIPAAVENAKIARETSSGTQEKFIALDIGPTGRLLKPFGDLDFEEAVAAFAAVVRIGAACGADLVTVETMNDAYETKAALLAVRENCDLPVFVTNAYNETGKLMTGAGPEAMTALLEGMGADAIGLNCSLGPAQLRPVAETILAHASVPVIFKPNAGLPRTENGRTVFDVDAETFVKETVKAVEAGVRVVGGCCGTTPAYIRLLHETLRDFVPAPILPKRETVISSYTHAVFFGKQPVLIGERINPTGKKRFRQALKEHDLPFLLEEGLHQAEKGVQVLDVNVGLPEIDERAMLTETVTALQGVTDLPLQLDTADPAAMESALRVYNGKALINSVNGKEESMQAVFPLVKKYGGTVIALTLDEAGIPETAEGRRKIAEKIKTTAAAYGIGPENLVFDPLAMTVSADKNAAKTTLEAIRLIREDLGCLTSLGVSNVSFGLPKREIINSAFFACALENGLSAAIMNPYSVDMMKTYRAFLTLHGFDENCAGYLDFCETLTEEVPEASARQTPENRPGEPAGTPLFAAIRRGLAENAGKITGELLKDREPLTIINEEIIPALDAVGKGFEEKTVFLPQLLMSASAAQSAFEVIKAACPAQKSDGLTVVLATVKGDIHDIGKNIVRLLLENYGFTVTDLGRDVPPETVKEAALRTGACLVGLSALMTTTVPAMEETIRLLHEQVPGVPVVVGGAVLNPEYAKEIGADYYAHDAMETVRIAEKIKKTRL